MANKDAGMRIRVEKELRDEFHHICRAQHRSAAQVLRDFMREYVQQHARTIQHSLFDRGDTP
ncbi:MAG: hypothetical protein OXN16_02765 [Gammaproteobacteria bacterium]|nr:hypothetical protein [Gammaproteobacteria bacterium]